MIKRLTKKKRKSCFTTVKERCDVVCKTTDDNQRIITEISKKICKKKVKVKETI